jgi:CheY-like chemotaxis protein
METDVSSMMGRRVVLVVDDDRAVQDAVREELANREYEVVIASDGDSALKLLDSLQPDVLVLDLQLPRVSGPTVAAKLRLMAKRPSLLICSAIAYAAEIAADVDADSVLLKPFVRADLRAEVERLLATR